MNQPFNSEGLIQKFGLRDLNDRICFNMYFIVHVSGFVSTAWNYHDSSSKVPMINRLRKPLFLIEERVPGDLSGVLPQRSLTLG